MSSVRADPDSLPPASPGAPDDFMPSVEASLPRPNLRARHLPWSATLTWLRAGWRDLWTNPLPSLAYGFGVALVSALVVAALFALKIDYVLFPALAGFMIIGPTVAAGLYEKSRLLEQGKSIKLFNMLFVKPRSGYQSLFMGVVLLGLMLLWMRAGVLIYALFFGLMPFPATGDILPMLLFTPQGWALLFVGSAAGALFAAFGFAISMIGVPILLEERTDALSALGISMATVWANRTVCIAWGGIVLLLFALGVATAFVGLVLTFPLLGHATWHAYRALRPLSEIGASQGQDLVPQP